MNAGELPTLRRLRAPADLPARAPIPGAAARVALVAVAVALALLVYGPRGWFYVGVLLALLAAAVPDYLLGWLLIVFLALGELGHRVTLDWRILVLIAGVHLLHVLAGLSYVVPWRSWLSPAALRAPLRRFLAIQLPCQLTAVAALGLLAPAAGGHRPLTLGVFALAGAGALALLALLLLRGR
jgi:hypothetical protein